MSNEKNVEESASAAIDRSIDDQKKRRLAEALRRNLRHRKKAATASPRDAAGQGDKQ